MGDRVHRYRTELAWAGSTGLGYEGYRRAHHARAGTAGPELELSADPAFLGDPAQLNPEQLVVLAASSCQLLSFLAVAARARIDVVAYRDVAEAEMPEADRPVRLTRIVLQPTVTVAGDAPGNDRLEHLTDVAHQECFIANSLRTEVVVEPTFQRRPATGP